MLKQFFLFFLFLTIGFCSTTAAYLFVTHTSFPLLSPIFNARFSLADAPSESLVGNITALSGNVLWLSRVATSPVTITKPQQIQQGEELETGNGEVTVQFPQDITIHIAKNSHAAVIQTLPANIVLQEKQGTIGYAGGSSTVPLSVRALDLLVSFSQAQATVVVDPAASQVVVYGENGTVQAAYTDAKNKTHVVSIAKNEKLVFNSKTKELVQ